MKKVLLLAAVVAAVWTLTLASESQKDVGDLLPIQTLMVTRQNGQLEVRGDGDLLGCGETWAAAMENLEQTASGEAFFGCTEHVVFDRNAISYLPDAMADHRLRPAARLYLSSGSVDPDEATAYLDAHPGGKTIQKLTADVLEGKPVKLPILHSDEGRLQLYDV